MLTQLRQATVDTGRWERSAGDHCIRCACERALRRRQLRRPGPCATPFGTAAAAQPSSRTRSSRWQSLRDRSGEQAGGRSDADQPTLPQLCHLIQQGFFELCIQNMGRPAAAAVTDVVRGAVSAARAGLSLERLRLQLEYSGDGGEGAIDAAGYRLTESERCYRLQWLDTVYLTYQLTTDAATESAATLAILRPRNDADAWLLAIVERVLAGQETGDEQSSVRFDRALATGGASGGAAAEQRVIAPQFVPVSQIVLLTVKVLRELEARSAA